MIKKRTIIILCALIAVLIALFFIVGGMESINKIIDFDDKSEILSMYKADESDVGKITVHTPDFEYTLERQDDGTWEYVEHREVTIDSNMCDSLAVEVSTVNANELIEESAKDLSLYGLEKSEYWVSAQIGDKIKKFIRGDATPVGDYYYFMDTDNRDVYTQYATKCSSIFKNISEYRSHGMVSVKPDDITYVAIKTDKENMIIEKSNEEPKTVNGYTYSLWHTTSPVEASVDDSKLDSEIITPICALYAKEFISDDGDFINYGINTPQATVTIRGKDGAEQTIYFGDRDENGAYYAAIDGGKTVYLIESEYTSFLSVDSFYLIMKFICLVDFNNCAKIDIVSSNQKYSLKTYDGKKDTFVINDKSINEQVFRTKIYQSVIGITADGYCFDSSYNNPNVKIVFNLRDGKTTNVEFVNYDNKFYAAYSDGNCKFKVKKESVAKMLKALSDNS